MNSRALTVICLPILLVLSGTMLGAAAVDMRGTLHTPAVTAGARHEPDRATALAFYQALNQALETGVQDSLARLLAPSFTLHDPPPGTSPDRAGLLRYVERLRAVQPDLRVAIDTVDAGATSISVRLTIEGQSAARFMAMPLTGDRPGWNKVNLLRAENNRITELWGVGESAGSPAPVTVLQSESHSTVVYAGLTNLTLAPETRTPDLTASGPLFFLAHDATATLTIDGQDRVLQPGALEMVPKQTPWALANRGPGAAMVTVLGLMPVAQTFPSLANAPDPAPRIPLFSANPNIISERVPFGAWPEGIVHEPIADSIFTTARKAVTVEAGLLTLPAGDAIAPHASTGAEMLTVVAGHLDLTLSEGRLRLRRAPEASPASPEVDPETGATWQYRLDAGGGAIAPPGTAIAARADHAGATLAVFRLTAEFVDRTNASAPSKNASR